MRLLIVAAAVGGIALIGALDFLTGVEYRVYPLYFLPLSLAAWHFGRRGAFAGAALCAFTWLGSNYLAGRSYAEREVWIFNFVMQGLAFVVVGWLIASLRGALARETSLSRTDSLTSLLNRRAFYEVAAQILVLGRRYGHPVTLAYIDLDNFKAINDTQGHEAGDDTLRRAAELLQRSIRRGDVAARFGGDEFVVLLPETGPAGAAPWLERLRSRMAETLDQKHHPITVTIGAIAFTTSPADVDDLVRRADTAMYAAKAAGKNRVNLLVADAPTQTNAV